MFLFLVNIYLVDIAIYPLDSVMEPSNSQASRVYYLKSFCDYENGLRYWGLEISREKFQ